MYTHSVIKSEVVMIDAELVKACGNFCGILSGIVEKKLELKMYIGNHRLRWGKSFFA